MTTILCRASKNIILLKEKEYDAELIDLLSIESIELLRSTVVQRYITDAVKVNDNIYRSLTEILRASIKTTDMPIFHLTIYTVTGNR